MRKCQPGCNVVTTTNKQTPFLVEFFLLNEIIPLYQTVPHLPPPGETALLKSKELSTWQVLVLVHTASLYLQKSEEKQQKALLSAPWHWLSGKCELSAFTRYFSVQSRPLKSQQPWSEAPLHSGRCVFILRTPMDHETERSTSWSTKWVLLEILRAGGGKEQGLLNADWKSTRNGGMGHQPDLQQ